MVKELLLELWIKISKNRRRQLIILLFTTFISTCLDMASLGALLPFISALLFPEKVFDSFLISSFGPLIGISGPQDVLLPLTVAFITIAIISGTTRLLNLWFANKIAFSIGADLSLEIYNKTLHQPYSIHVQRNTSELVSAIFNKVNEVVFWTILPLITLMSSAIFLIATMAVLLIVDFFVSGVAFFVFGAGYTFVVFVTRRKLLENGIIISKTQTKVLKALQEGLGGIRDVLLGGNQQVYIDIYRKADLPLRRAYASNNFLAGCPRYIMEAVGMILIAVLAYWLSATDGGFVSMLPVLGTLAVAAQRMLPALQQGYSAWANATGTLASLADTVKLLNQPTNNEEIIETDLTIELSKNIKLKNISFKYDQNGPYILNNLNLSVSKGDRVGIVGTTGTGKSTLLDILMGLLSPTSGMIIIDNTVLQGPFLSAWKKNIAHVPQSIYLSDSSIYENIAFGVAPENIDKDRVHDAAMKAQMHDVIANLPRKYDTKVGERGIRMSGGQRQRIGIARALYKNAEVLIFDEATSSLDGVTEASVMESIENLDKNLTVFIVAHRLTTLKKCTKIIELDGGQVVREIAADELHTL